MNKKTDWIQTFTGIKFYPLEPDIESICIIDIAKSLSHLCRFNGHCNRFYSVAEHSLHCLSVARRMGLSYQDRYAALLHDSAEAYLADIPRPVKRAISGYSEHESRLENIIANKYDILNYHSPVIKKIDDIMLATERRDLFNDPLPWGSITEEPTTYFNITQPLPASSVPLFMVFINEFINLRKALRLPVENEAL